MQPFNAGQSVRAMVCKLQPTLRNASAAAPHTCERARNVPNFNVNTCTRTRAQPLPPYNKCKAKRFTTAKAAATKLFVIQNQNSIDTTHTICREECEDRSADATPCVGTCHHWDDRYHSFIHSDDIIYWIKLLHCRTGHSDLYRYQPELASACVYSMFQTYEANLLILV